LIKEILRITNLKNSRDKGEGNNINFAVYEGEILSFVGFANSGKFFVSEFLKGNKNATVEYISYRGESVKSINNIQKKIFSQNAFSANIKKLNMGNWTVAEFLMLEKYKSFLGLINTKKINELSKTFLNKFNLKLDVEQPFNDCSIYEKQLLELIKIYDSEAKIIIIEEDMPDLNVEEINKLKLKIKEIFKDKAIIIISYSDNISFRMADRFILMEKGKIIKKWNAKRSISKESLKSYFTLIHSVPNKDEETYYYSIEKSRFINKSHCIFFSLNNKKIKLPLLKSSLVIFLVEDSRMKVPIFEYLSNIKIYSHKFLNIKSIGIIKNLGDEGDLLTKMSIGENLLLPSYKTYSNKDFLLNHYSMIKVVEHELHNSFGTEVTTKDLSTNQKIHISLERWYLRNPDILLILEPFEKCDDKGIEMVKSYINKFKEKGTIIIFLNSRLEHSIETDTILIKI
jgi:ABC-type sugar transport system ATPase subunit